MASAGDITEQHRAEVQREMQHAVVRALADASRAEQAATGTIAAVATAQGWSCGEFWLADPAADTISRISRWTSPGLDLEAFSNDETVTFARGYGLPGLIWQTDAQLWIPEVADDPRSVARQAAAVAAGGAPLIPAIHARIHPADEHRMAALRHSVMQGNSGEAEIRINGMDGVTRWIWLRLGPRREGSRLFVDGNATDITERRELTEQREQLLAGKQLRNQQLRELDRMKDELVALVSHELRNPLSTIAAYTEILLDDPDLDPAHRNLIRVIDKHGRHMHALVDDLLELARFDAGQMPIDRRSVPLARAVREYVDDRRAGAWAGADQLGIVADVARHLPVYADPARLRQVLDILVSNAVTYTPAGGTITISGRLGELPSGVPAAVLRVTDSGFGIPAEQCPHLFERFFRGSNAVSRGVRGTGLGLAITKAIVDAHGGTISAAPAEPTPGTTFTVRLPSGPATG